MSSEFAEPVARTPALFFFVLLGSNYTSQLRCIGLVETLLIKLRSQRTTGNTSWDGTQLTFLVIYIFINDAITRNKKKKQTTNFELGASLHSPEALANSSRRCYKCKVQEKKESISLHPSLPASVSLLRTQLDFLPTRSAILLLLVTANSHLVSPHISHWILGDEQKYPAMKNPTFIQNRKAKESFPSGKIFPWEKVSPWETHPEILRRKKCKGTWRKRNKGKP